MKGTLIDRIADQLGLPDLAPVSPVKRDQAALRREFLMLHQLHTMHHGALLDAMMIESRAIENTRQIRKLVAETRTRLELLAAETGVPDQFDQPDWTIDIDQAREDAKADAGDSRRKSEVEDVVGGPRGS